MAIKTFKEILNNKGYRISSKDRQIFESGNLESFFGFSNSDAIEFIVYDVDDNQLPQKDGIMVRYIPLSSENIKDYFLVAEGTMFQQHKFPKEYFIDAERLLRESGYNNGIFKTQITLLNKRVGSDSTFDKLWISEISPSRTEVRLLPLNKGVDLNPKLEERYQLFIKNGDFRDDTIQESIPFIEKVKPNEVDTFIKSKYSEKWFNKLKTEFKIPQFDSFATKLHEKFIQSCTYEFTNRVSYIRDNDYGKPKVTAPKLELSRTEIQEICKKILVQCIDYYLPKQDIKSTTTFDSATDSSMDEVGIILQRLEENTLVDTSTPIVKFAEIIKPVQTEKQLKLEEEIKKELPVEKEPIKIIIVTPDAEPDYIPPPPPEQPVYSDEPPSGGGGGGGGSNYREYDTLDRQNIGDGGMGRERMEFQ
jgi:hypothetical protein